MQQRGDRQAGDQRRRQLTVTADDLAGIHHRCRSAAASVAVGVGGRHHRVGRAVPLRCGHQPGLPLVDLLEISLRQADFAAAWNTIQLTVLSMVLAVVLGVVLAVMRLSPNPVLRSVSWVYIWIFRGTPVYVQLVFWGLFPVLYKNIQLGIPFGPSFFHFSRAAAVAVSSSLSVIGLGLNEAAYMAEIIRAGISSVPEGQTEASTALGMSWWMTMRRTILPQAMRVIIPPTGNEVISMLKTTSLVIAVPYSAGALWPSTRDRRGVLPADSVADGRRDVVPGHHQRPHGRAVLPGAVLLAGRVAETDVQTARSAGPGAAGGGGTPMTAMVVAERVCKRLRRAEGAQGRHADGRTRPGDVHRRPVGLG